MSAVGITFSRTLGRARNLYSTAFAVGVFLAAVGGLFAWQLVAADGQRLSLSVLWASAVAWVLPVFIAFLAMEVWSDERSSGRLELLLTTAVRERSLVLGKFFGVTMVALLSIGCSLLTVITPLVLFSPETLRGFSLVELMPAFFVLTLQSAFYAAIALAVGVLTVRPAAAFCASVLLLSVLPRLAFIAYRNLSASGRTAFGEFPLDVHVIDMASGSLSSAALVFYLVFTGSGLFLGSKAVAVLRLGGRAGAVRRRSSYFAALLGVIFAALASVVALRTEVLLDLPISGFSTLISPRSRSILADTYGHVVVSVYLSSSDERFKPIAQLLRLLKREASAVGGARIELEFIDPNWDIAAAERLVRRGVVEDSLVFSTERRMVALPLRDGFGERLCVSAIRRLMTPPSRRNIYWTQKHGEVDYQDYSTFGLSDIVRELSREGYRHSTIDLQTLGTVPGDCALIVIAGATTEFSRVELDRLEAYLKEGGRLLVLLSNPDVLSSLLPAWGIRVVRPNLADMPSENGANVIVDEFSRHAVTTPLAGSRLILDRPLAFEASAVVTGAATGERLAFHPLAAVGRNIFAAAVERGAGVGADLAVRPMRLVAVGDATFVINGQLTARGSANRDFLLNAAMWLSGAEIAGSGGVEMDVLKVRLDQTGRFRYLLVAVGVLPLAVYVVMVLVAFRRRNRV